jgi:hypothetical protein
MFPLSSGAPTMAVLPSADSATEKPCSAAPSALVPTNFGPSCENCAIANCDEKSRAPTIRTDALNDRDERKCDMGQTCVVIGPPGRMESTPLERSLVEIERYQNRHGVDATSGAADANSPRLVRRTRDEVVGSSSATRPPDVARRSVVGPQRSSGYATDDPGLRRAEPKLHLWDQLVALLRGADTVAREEVRPATTRLS